MSDVIGELIEPQSPKRVDWKIPNFSSLSFVGSYKGYYSPSFRFPDRSWRLRVYKNDERNSCLTVLLFREGCVLRVVTCSLSIKKADGTLFGTETASLTSSHYFRNFINMPVLQERAFELLPAGVLTITCALLESRPKNMLYSTPHWRPRHQKERKRPAAEEENNLNKKPSVEDAEHTELADLRSLRQMYKQVLVNGQNHDVILKVGDKEFPAHRDILRARSRVFKDMLSNSVKEKNNEVVDVDVPDCNPKAVEQFLLYIYCGTVEMLDESNMFGLYYLSNKYDIPALKILSRDFIIKSMSPTNICDVILVAMNQDDSSLMECTTEYFCNNLDNILNTAEWQSFMKDNCALANDLLKKGVFKLQNPKAKELITID